MLNNLVGKQKFSSNFGFCIIELRGLFFNCICNGGLLLQNFVYHFTCLGDIGVVALYFSSSISHFVDRLIDYNFGVGLAHDFVNLVALGPDEEGNHTFRHKNDNRKLLLFNRFIDLINIIKQSLGALILLLHLYIVNLDVLPIQIRNPQIRIELDRLYLVLRSQRRKPGIVGLEFL